LPVIEMEKPTAWVQGSQGGGRWKGSEERKPRQW